MGVPIQIIEEINALPVDVRAEVIVGQLLEGKLNWDEMVVHSNKFFYRSFSKDIYNASVDDSAAFKELLHLNLSRTGLYDILPEGLFFQPQTTTHSPKSAGEMAEEYKINKKQETEVRKFFSPLENEFFYHRYKNFKTERILLNGLNNELLRQYFIRFWNLAKDIKPAMALSITLLLPYVHQIAGDCTLMGGCLQHILEEKVSCTIENRDSQAPLVVNNVLGNFNLGDELVCGNWYHEDEIYFVFTIYDLKKSAAQDYLRGGKLYSALHTFYRFFVPVNAEIETVIKLKKSKEEMQIGDMEQAVLGIATVI